MARRVFISYEGSDRDRAKGFNLLRWNKNVDVEFVGRHLLDPVDSTNRDYITRRIKEEINGSSVTIVLIGKETCDSDWVAREVQWSLEKDGPNGILGIRLDDGVRIPEALVDCGAEIINWDPHKFANAIERAALQARRAPMLQSGGVARSCSR